MPNRRAVARSVLALSMLAPPVTGACAQDNYEIQVYGGETVAPGRTMVELHSNFTAEGRRTVDNGLFATEHAIHETLEITRGLNDWAELGFYVFSSARAGQGWQWVGDHVRPRVRAPLAWNWPLGVSLSAEVGYQRREFSRDSWTLEVRPIVDKQLGRWYAALNPTLDRALRGETASRGFEFSPAAAVGFDVTSRVNLGAEYYGALGSIRGFDPVAEQQHQLFGVVNLNVGPDWEINAGYGQALTAGGDRRLVKLILGRRLGSTRPHPLDSSLTTHD